MVDLSCYGPNGPTIGVHNWRNLINYNALQEHQSKSRHRKFILRCASHNRTINRLVSYLQELNYPSWLIAHILDKPRKGYIIKGFSTAQRYQLLCDHYQQLSQLGFHSLPINEPYLLGAYRASEDAAPINILLQPDQGGSHEGELAITLSTEQHGHLYTIMFSLIMHQGQRILLIGCVQGGRFNNEDGLQLMRSLTRQHHGLRPKSMLIPAIQYLAQRWQCAYILGVSSDFHYYKTTNRRKNNVQFDYDQFWQENGGYRFNPESFALPLVTPRKELTDIASKKRGLYRKRYAMMDQLNDQLHHSCSIFS